MFADDLTPRQVEVLKLIATGTTTAQVARQLHVTENTVRNHLVAISTALGAHNRLEAVHLWRKSRHPAERILRFAYREGIRLTDEQAAAIRAALRSPRMPRG